MIGQKRTIHPLYMKRDAGHGQHPVWHRRRLQRRRTADSAVLLPGDQTISGPRLTFHRVPEAKVVKNRLHLDLISDTFDAETERLLSLGARRLSDIQGTKFRWTTFADIEGNEFDLIAGQG